MGHFSGKHKKQLPFSFQKAKNYLSDFCETGKETSKATVYSVAS